MKTINKNSFKLAMSKFASGITIISINNKKSFIGKTVSSFSSLSLSPPLCLFALDKNSSSISKFVNSKFIGINILDKKQKKLSKHFAIKNNLWGNTKFFLSKNKVPLVKNAIVNLNCQKFKTYRIGDHIIFICKILELQIIKSKKPLIYYNNKYF